MGRTGNKQKKGGPGRGAGGEVIPVMEAVLGLEGAVDTGQGDGLRKARKGERRCEYDMSSVKTGTVAHLPRLNPRCLAQSRSSLNSE